MKLLPLLVIFLIFCIITGANTGAKSIKRGATHIRSRLRDKDVTAMRDADECESDVTDDAKVHGWNQRCINDLKGSFALYQSGALSKDEFEQVKRQLLSKMKAYA
ncbi:SHOCT domain-containing protein [Burkholderia vietnamiensis]|uniref:SHOCT domain-containing protein n=1 Tax=Burkholderia vietnamiensis TaxID=60552 RepID=UPI0015948BBA|nr:SHOCT domain-containing protein [Burkholderia vietnamiensis]